MGSDQDHRRRPGRRGDEIIGEVALGCCTGPGSVVAAQTHRETAFFSPPAHSRSQNGVAEPVIGPATSGRTRWLAYARSAWWGGAQAACGRRAFLIQRRCEASAMGGGILLARPPPRLISLT